MNEFTLTRDIATPQDRVWSAFTDGAEYAAWIWPAEWETTCQIDPRVGGSFRLESPPTGIGVTGTYLEVDPKSRLVLTWTWDGDNNESRVTIALEPIATGTRLTLTHEGLASEEEAANHQQGWNDCLDRLEPYLA